MMIFTQKLLRGTAAGICGLACLFAVGVTVAAEGFGHKRPRGIEYRPLFQLTTQHGHQLHPTALRGRPFIVAFGFTNCPDVCPTTLLDLSNQLADLGPAADKLTVLFVTVDPERDTVEHLRAFLGSFDPRIIGLTGNVVDVAAAAHGLQASYERVDRSDANYSVNHTTNVYYFDRYGLLAATINPFVVRPATVRDLLARLIAQ